MEVCKSDVTKEKFMLFMKEGDISHICKYETNIDMNVLKETINGLKSKIPSEIVEKLEKDKIIDTIIEPTARFLIIRL